MAKKQLKVKSGIDNVILRFTPPDEVLSLQVLQGIPKPECGFEFSPKVLSMGIFEKCSLEHMDHQFNSASLKDDDPISGAHGWVPAVSDRELLFYRLLDPWVLGEELTDWYLNHAFLLESSLDELCKTFLWDVEVLSDNRSILIAATNPVRAIDENGLRHRDSQGPILPAWVLVYEGGMVKLLTRDQDGYPE